jgi:hypothetical protein
MAECLSCAALSGDRGYDAAVWVKRARSKLTRCGSRCFPPVLSKLMSNHSPGTKTPASGAVHESLRELQIAMRTAGAQELATPRGWDRS